MKPDINSMTDAEFKAYIAAEAEKAKLESRRRTWPQVDALLTAGWRLELPEIVNNWKSIETEPWQWYWRSPPKRARSKGRKYWSTNQAFNAHNRLKPTEAA